MGMPRSEWLASAHKGPTMKKREIFTTEAAARAAASCRLQPWGVVEYPPNCDGGAYSYELRQPFNLEIHHHLVSLGYEFTPFPAEFDDGDPENGPGFGGCAAWDQYQNASEYICVESDGRVVHREDRDLNVETAFFGE
jgi:hypothetical protein